MKKNLFESLLEEVYDEQKKIAHLFLEIIVNQSYWCK